MLCLGSTVNINNKLKSLRVMEFKLRANIVMSKELTVEAEHLDEAMKKAEEMMAGPISMKELKTSKVYFDVLSGIKWMDESKYLRKK